MISCNTQRDEHVHLQPTRDDHAHDCIGGHFLRPQGLIRYFLSDEELDVRLQVLNKLPDANTAVPLAGNGPCGIK